MDSRDVASALGTDSKTLRRFLRSDASTVTPVGSGGRYAFDEADMPTIRDEFGVWLAGAPVKAPPVAKVRPRVARTPQARDKAIWEDEGDVVLPDISNPEILRAVRASEAAREARLLGLMAKAGLTTRPRTSARV